MLFKATVSGAEASESFEHTDDTFKPGWKDIFRMNQNELESEVRKVSRDSTLDPRRKAYLLQNLMTRYVHVLIISRTLMFSLVNPCCISLVLIK